MTVFDWQDRLYWFLVKYLVKTHDLYWVYKSWSFLTVFDIEDNIYERCFTGMIREAIYRLGFIMYLAKSLYKKSSTTSRFGSILASSAVSSNAPMGVDPYLSFRVSSSTVYCSRYFSTSKQSSFFIRILYIFQSYFLGFHLRWHLVRNFYDATAFSYCGVFDPLSGRCFTAGSMKDFIKPTGF